MAYSKQESVHCAWRREKEGLYGAHSDVSFPVALSTSVRVEGYAIVFEDGMLADANGIMPDVLKTDADQRFFERGLAGVDVPNPRPQFPRASSQFIQTLSYHSNEACCRDDAQFCSKRAVLWNPVGAPLREALALLRAPHRSIGVLGGTSVLDRYDVFYLSCERRHPFRRPASISAVPARSPAEILRAHGLARCTVERAAANLTIET